MPILAILFTEGGVCVCREWFKPTKPRGLELGMQGDGSTTKPDMIMDVGL